MNHAPPPPAIATNQSVEMMEATRPRRKDRTTFATQDEQDHSITQRKQRPSKQSFDYIWRSGVAGGMAGCAAKSVVAPLDRVKILFQARNPQFQKYTGSWFGVVVAMKDIYQSEGVVGLFRGHSATLLRIFPYAGIKFLAYEQIRNAIIPNKAHETPFRRLVSGSLAGVTSVFFTYPLELIRVRLAFETRADKPHTLSSVCRSIYNERPPELKPQVAVTSGASTVTATAQSVANTASAKLEVITARSGLSNFYRGFAPTLIGMLPYAGISFLTHDTAGDAFRHPSIAKWTTLPRPANSPPDKPAPLCSWAELTAGGLAGLLSQTASYPFEVVRRRMQVGGAVGDGHRLRIAETVALIYKERGMPGYFVGLTIGYVKVIPMVAVSFYAYERSKTWLGI